MVNVTIYGSTMDPTMGLSKPQGETITEHLIAGMEHRDTSRMILEAAVSMKKHLKVCLKMGYIPNYSHLVGIMIINPLWKILVSWDDDIPNIWKNEQCSKPPTSKGAIRCHLQIQNELLQNDSNMCGKQELWMLAKSCTSWWLLGPSRLPPEAKSTSGFRPRDAMPWTTSMPHFRDGKHTFEGHRGHPNSEIIVQLA